MPSFDEEIDQVIRRQLDSIALLEAAPGKTIIIVRNLHNGERYRTKDWIPLSVYEALRAAVWKMLAFGWRGDELGTWYDILRQVSALYSSSGYEDVSRGIRVLADLVLESQRFGYTHNDQAERKHEQDIVALLKTKSPLSCRNVHNETGMGLDFVIRATNNMAAAHIIRKRGYGESALLSLPTSAT